MAISWSLILFLLKMAVSLFNEDDDVHDAVYFTLIHRSVHFFFLLFIFFISSYAHLVILASLLQDKLQEMELQRQLGQTFFF